MSTEPTSEAGTPAQVKVIKRYSNRKLYDTERSKYVTLDEIARMIKAGEEVQIIDNESKEDLTSVTLTQIIFEEEKRESRMPLEMLRNLIQTGGSTLQEFFDRSLKGPVVEMRESAQKNIEEVRQSAFKLRDAATRSVTELTDSARRMFSREERREEELRKTFLEHFADMNDRLTQRITELEALRHAEPSPPEVGENAPGRRDTLLAAQERTAGTTELVRRGLDELGILLDRVDETSRDLGS